MSHLQLSFYGRVGDQHGHNGVSIGHGLGGVERMAISFWRRGLGGWRLVFISVCVQHRTF